MIIKLLFNRHHWWMTLLVIAGMFVLVGLGRWQLDRLQQRRAYNAGVARQLAAPPLDLNGPIVPDELTGLVNRQARVEGEFDFAHQVAWRNQSSYGQPGVHLITPLRIKGSNIAILVDRGWIPYEESTPDHWAQYDEPAIADVTGYLQKSHVKPGGGSGSTPTPQPAWFWLDISAIQGQIPYRLLPVYLLESPQPGRALDALPRREKFQVDLSDGPHLSYALQWFSFALILGVGYVLLLRKREQELAEAATRVTETPVAPGSHQHASG